MLNAPVKTQDAKPFEKTPKRRRRRFEWKRVKVKVLYRTWWRHGSGTKLLHSEIVEEARLVKVPVKGKPEKEVAK